MSFADASCRRRGYGAAVSPLTADLFSDESTDGPALTPDGRVVDLEHGQALYFSHDKIFSPSNEAKLLLKDEHRMCSAVKVAHAACEAEKIFSDEHPGHLLQGGMFERKCSIDSDGVLHDADIINLPPPSPADKSGKSERLKRFHRKQASRKVGNAYHVIDVVDNEGTVQGFKKNACEAEMIFLDYHPGHLLQCGMPERKCSIDSDGVLHDADVINLPPPSPADKCGKSERLKRFHRKQASRKVVNADHVIDVVDNEGTVQGFKKRSMSPLIVRVGDEACVRL